MTRRLLLPLLAPLLPLGAFAAGSAEQAETNETMPAGPGRLCLRDSSLDLLADETVGVAQNGRHGIVIEVSGPSGDFTYAENEAFVEPRTAGEPVAVRAGLRVTRHHRQGQIAYLFRGPIAAYGPELVHPLVWIKGPALSGGRADVDILARVRTGPPEGCILRYDYGFEGIPLVGNAQ